MKKDRKLSTLEQTVLGLAWLRGPCTIYVLMKMLSNAGSTYYKSRAGTAYSIGNRLIKEGLLEFDTPSGENEDRKVRISEKGLAALREWMKPPLSPTDAAFSSDLIRLRFYFLGSIDKEERLGLIESARAETEKVVKMCKGFLIDNENIEDYFGVLATMSAILEFEARLKFLDLVKDLVENPMKPGEAWSEKALKILESK